ncbi:MAG: hypothetical protein ACI8PW_000039 [Methylophilaceae bacterium]|jgi:uncharacterized protein YqgC (DUF456 family)
MDWYWIVVGLLVIVGFMGLLVPILPGIVFIFSGLLLAAWLDDFSRVSEVTMTVIGLFSLMAWVIDFFASYFTAKKANASKLALFGVMIGALVGILGGVVGLIIGPIIGAVIGEFIARKNSGDAVRVGVAAGLGFLVALVVKLVLAIMITSIFAYAYFY